MKYICNICNKECKSLKSLRSHEWKSHTDAGVKHIPMLGRKHSNATKEKCKIVNLGRISGSKGKKFPGRKMSEDAKKKISAGMKKAHADGRAHNIGMSRWNNEPSWPEKWFMDVVANEFNDKNYTKEHPFYRFSLDFVWLHKKRVIEIDGEQHERFQEQKERDSQKDSLLVEEGYDILRMKWKDICNNTKSSILRMKEFIDD
jgi:very-short-patch-repair endonuclease